MFGVTGAARPYFMLVIALVRLAWAADCVATLPVTSDPPSKGELEILRLLSRDELEAGNLKPILFEAVRDDLRREYRVAAILAEAVKVRSIPEGTVWRAFGQIACDESKQTEARCWHFTQAFRAALVYQPQQPVGLAEARSRILKLAERETGGHLGMEAEYVRALFASRGMNLSDLLTGFVRGDLPSPIDPADQAVVAAIGLVERNGHREFDRGYLVVRLRQAFGSAVGLVLQDWHGNSEIVRQAREVPAELLREVTSVRSQYIGEMMTSTTLCILDHWREENEPPDRWRAWSQFLSCRGR
jgi:hypothetical protein